MSSRREEHIRRLVDAAPPLTAWQRDRISAVVNLPPLNLDAILNKSDREIAQVSLTRRDDPPAPSGQAVVTRPGDQHEDYQTPASPQG